MTRAARADEMLTVHEVIEWLGIPRPTFYRWRATGSAPTSFRLPNGEIRIWRSDLERWLRNLMDTRG